jgi:Sel1 repeat-containing protein
MSWFVRCLVLMLMLPAILAGQAAPTTSWNINELGSEAKRLGAADLPDLRSRAEAGDARAQFLLGLAYEFAYAGLTKDLAEALRWNKLAAQHGIGLVETWVGDFYYDGLGVAMDYAEALSWYHRASERGHAQASRYIGDFTLFGLGTARDPAHAAVWYAKAASQGDARAKARLALLSPPCEDDFCAVVRTLIISRDNSFKDLKGPRSLEPFKDVFAGTLKPAGADACQVTAPDLTQKTGAEYECVFPASSDELAAKVRAALPNGWVTEVQDLALLSGPDDFDLAVSLSGAGLKILAPYREPRP